MIKPNETPTSKDAGSRRTIKLLKILSGKDLKNLLLFAQCPYFHVHQQAVDLLVKVAALQPDFSSEAMDTIIHVNDKAQNKLLSEINDIIEQFLAVQALQKDKSRTQLYLLERISLAGDEALFQNYADKALQLQLDEPVSIDSLYHNYAMNTQILLHWSNHHNVLQSASFKREQLAYHTFIDAIQTLNASATQSRKSAKADTERKYYPPQADVFIQILLRLNTLSAKKQSDSDEYDQIFKLFSDHHTNMAPVEKDSVFRLLFNYCVRFGFYEGVEFKKQLEHLFKWGQSSKILHDRWKKSDEDYLNFATLMIKGKSESEVIQFLEDNLPLLPSKNTESIQYLLLSNTALDAGEIVKGLDYINLVTVKKTVFGIRAQSLLLRLSFENWLKTRDDMDMTRILENYRKYFERKEMVNDTRRAQLMRLHYFVNQMYLIQKRLNTKTPPPKIYEQLAKELDDENQLRPVAIEWLRKIMMNDE
jgi:hypothetical protein